MPYQPSPPPNNSSDRESWADDEIMREVYRNRDEYAAEHNYDLARIFEDLKKREAQSTLKRAEALGDHS